MAKQIQVVQQGSTYSFVNAEDSLVLSSLPAGTYQVIQPMPGKFVLSKIEDFTLPPKLYGNTQAVAERILNTKKKKGALGVLLRGNKGSGKTLLAKSVSVLAHAQGIPTLLISSEFEGTAFNMFIQSIAQEVILQFDEFEKVYSAEGQTALLSLLDGPYASDKLVIFTVNDARKVDQHMMNRPGRIHYALSFARIGDDVVDDYCKKHLKNKSELGALKKMLTTIPHANFDMLQAIIWEMNEYDESPQKTLEMLNVTPHSDDSFYQAEIFHNGVSLLEEGWSFRRDGNIVNRSPRHIREWGFSLTKPNDIEEDEENEDSDGTQELYLTITESTFQGYDPLDGIYTFGVVGKEGYTVQLKYKYPSELSSF